MNVKQEIKISQLLEDLENGLKRPTIAEKYNITMSDLNKIFQHPLLKGKKARKQISIILVDDVTEEVAENQTSIEEQIKEVEDADVENVSDLQTEKDETNAIEEIEDAVVEHEWEN